MRVLVLVSLAAALVAASVARGQSEGALRDRIEDGRAAESALGDAIARLQALEEEAAADVAALEDRVADAQAELTAAEVALRETEADLGDARRRVVALERRLAAVRVKLAALLRARYVSDPPDLVTVVLNANGFRDLLETVEFLKRVQRSDERLLARVREARAAALDERARLNDLSVRREETADTLARRRDALAGVLDGLHVRREALTRARTAREAALSRTRDGRRDAERALRKLEAEQARAAVSVEGPGGPWAIPWAIVQCESGGQNLPPNFAGASGYYQFMPATWRALGGSTPHAYQAPKAEQDRLAAQLWAGGAGARNWVCATLV